MDTGIVELYQYFGQQSPCGLQAQLYRWIPGQIFARQKRPAVLILPGGGYGHVSAREAEPAALRLAAQGYAAFVLVYSCAPARFPEALRQAAMAMAYIREKAENYGIDPHQVAAMGFSAGGHLCGTLGTLYDSPQVADIAGPEVLRPDALGLCYPVAVSWGRTHEDSFYNLCGQDPSLRQQLSLERLVRPDMPPVFLWHTRDDPSVPCRNSLVLAAALEEAGVDFALHIYRHGPHGLATADQMAYAAGQVPAMSRDVPGWVDALLEFFRELGFGIKERGV